MKKFYTVLLALLLACFVSCSNGDDDTDDTPVSNSTSSTTITDNTSSSSSTTDSTTTTETTGNNGSSTTDSNNTSSTDDSNSIDNTTTTSGASYNFATAGENDDILAVVSTLKNGDTLYISGKMTEDDVITLANAIKTIDEDEILINLDMSGVVSIMHGYGYDYEYWEREDGVKMFGAYVMCAANLDVHPRGSLVESSLGTAIVCDTGGFAESNPNQLDIAVNW
mgnify:CR=1 FL=1